ncbi:uncharacterized protein BJ171DRAFT_491673 [Polychytrium aggregatum]|uniref:uncharacterized protein n=1 Tax=Polychytrium aggregatum TaxID=110093 RepID=UPI0022FDE9B5|nr:uncharacterized protein BJ171DRAFT_491673 [Polychytrium aggregatum]KAI9207838.1 hypothetical protein BJ171DRAFT_491673 [Polychytrium aggregatum]
MASLDSARSSLSNHDLLTILVCNDSFVRFLDLPTLGRLPQLARQYRGVLSLTSTDPWMNKLYRRLKVTEAVFANLQGIDRRAVLEGVCSFLGRKDGYPQGRGAYQKELPLWWAFVKLPAMEGSKIQDLLAQALRKMKSLRCLCAIKSIPSNIADLCPQEQFQLFDSSQILRVNSCRHCLYSRRYGHFDGLLTVARFPSHPFHTDKHMSCLLPHEHYFLEKTYLRNLALVNCSFLPLSDRPRGLDGLESLVVVDTQPQGIVEDLDGMPALPMLSALALPRSLLSFDGMPQSFQCLMSLDISACPRLVSFQGLPKLPRLRTLKLPQSSDCLSRLLSPATYSAESPKEKSPSRTDGGLGTVMPSLAELWLSSSLCGLDALAATLQTITTLHLVVDEPEYGFEELPSMPELETLSIHGSVANLSWLSGHPDSPASGKGSSHSAACSSRKRSRTPRLQSLVLPASIESLNQVPEYLQTIRLLDLSACTRLRLANGLAQMPALVELKLPMSATDLRFMPAWLNSIRRLSLKGSALESLRGMPAMDSLEMLSLDLPLTSLEGMPSVLPSLQELHLQQHCNLRALGGMSEMPRLKGLSLLRSIATLEGMPTTLESIVCIDIGMCSKLTSLKGLPSMPALRELRFPPNIKSLDIASVHLDSLETLWMNDCMVLKTLEGFPQTPRLKTLHLPPSLESLRGFPEHLEHMSSLDLSGCFRLESLVGFPPSLGLILESLTLPLMLKSLNGLPPAMAAIRVLHLAWAYNRATGEELLRSCSQMPLLQLLGPEDSDPAVIPDSLTALDVTMEAALAAGLPRMPKLGEVALRASAANRRVIGELRAAVDGHRPSVCPKPE